MRKPVLALSRFTLDYVKRALADGTARSSVASRNLQELQEGNKLNPETELILSDVTATMYAGGFSICALQTILSSAQADD